MQTKRIKCPNCGVVLDVKNSKDEAVKLITCPQCGVTLRVKFPAVQQPKQPLDAETFIATKKPQQQSSDTVLAKKKTQSGKKPVLSFLGRQYSLFIGENIVGRQASTSNASLQIATNDHYMSRHHAKITITRLSDGTIKAVIRNYQNKNATMVDGMRLNDDDAVVLQPGSQIVMGGTTVTFNIM